MYLDSYATMPTPFEGEGSITAVNTPTRWSIARAMPALVMKDAWMPTASLYHRFDVHYVINPSSTRIQAAAEIFIRITTGSYRTPVQHMYQEMNSLPNHVWELDEDLLFWMVAWWLLLLAGFRSDRSDRSKNASIPVNVFWRICNLELDVDGHQILTAEDKNLC